MGIKEDYYVQPIPKNECNEWLVNKHYARRIPQITYAFGLYSSKERLLEGIITFGNPCRHLNNGYGIFGGEIEVPTQELNRLCVNEGLPRNALSFFVAQALVLLPKPMCLVSYADKNQGHHGYIYQATNWLYTGVSTAQAIFIDKRTGKQVHRRTINSNFGTSDPDKLPDYIDYNMEEDGKFRYIKFLGSKKDVKHMKNHFKYGIFDYPKGQNDRYDASYDANENQQMTLF